MSDIVTETIHHSWGSRMRNSGRGMVCGPILILLSSILLFWNEGRTLHRAQDLDEVMGQVQILESASQVDPGLEGKLIYVTGSLKTDDPLVDSEFGVSKNAIKLKRTVETYQWVEEMHEYTKKNSDGSTDTVRSYTYFKAWRSNLIDSSSFHNSTLRDNPKMARFQQQSFVADPIHLGAFDLSDPVTNLIGGYTAIRDLTVDSIPEDSAAMGATKENQYFFYGDDAYYPEVGDTRVSFSMIPSGIDVSIIAKQAGKSFAVYSSSRGGEVILVERGTVTAEDMILHAKEANVVTMWFLRILGGFLLFLGLRGLLEPLATFADGIPIVGPLLSNFIGCGISFVALGLTFVWAMLVIALAWLFYRPLMAMLFLFVVGLFVGGVVWLVKRRQSQGAGAGGDGAIGKYSEVAPAVADDALEMT